MKDISLRIKELLCVLEVPEGSQITVEEKKSGYLDIAVNGNYFDTYNVAKDRLVQGNLCFVRQIMQRENYVTAAIANPKLYCVNEQYEAAEVWCPATVDEWEDAMQRARIEGKGIDLVECSIMDREFNDSDCLMEDTSLEELDFLGERLCTMDEVERILFKGRMEKHSVKTVTVKDYINMTYNLEQCQIAFDVTNLKELGEFFAEQNMVPELQNLPPETLDLIDYTKIGERIHAEKEGIFIEEGYFYDETTDFEIVYDGKTLPEKSEKDTYLFRVKVSKQKSPEETAEGVWISLPKEAEQLQNVPNALGADSWDECRLLGLQSVLRGMRLCILPKDIERLNTLAQEVNALNRMEQMKFKAILEVSEYHTLDDVRALFEQLENYQLYSTMVTVEDYVQQQLEAKMKAEFPKDLVEFIDFEGYYETRQIENQVADVFIKEAFRAMNEAELSSILSRIEHTDAELTPAVDMRIHKGIYIPKRKIPWKAIVVAVLIAIISLSGIAGVSSGFLQQFYTEVQSQLNMIIFQTEQNVFTTDGKPAIAVYRELQEQTNVALVIPSVLPDGAEIIKVETGQECAKLVYRIDSNTYLTLTQQPAEAEPPFQIPLDNNEAQPMQVTILGEPASGIQLQMQDETVSTIFVWLNESTKDVRKYTQYRLIISQKAPIDRCRLDEVLSNLKYFD